MLAQGKLRSSKRAACKAAAFRAMRTGSLGMRDVGPAEPLDLESMCNCGSQKRVSPVSICVKLWGQNDVFDVFDENALLVDQGVQGPAIRAERVYPKVGCSQLLLLGCLLALIFGLSAFVGYLMLQRERPWETAPQSMPSSDELKACPVTVHENCPAEWLISSNPGGYHCLQKLARQKSESAYETSKGACRPKSAGRFPETDCHQQCSIGNVEAS
eukprot:Skav233277  [mRNA]  locus=scaffold3673:41667:45002:- [translate_table: standard]